jgi:glycosyl transferase, family 25
MQDWQTLLNGFFERIFVITIPRAAERHEHVRSYLDGVRFEFLYGTDKYSLELPALVRDGIYNDEAARKVGRFTRSLSMGEIACSMSHRAVLRTIVDQKISRALIMEDDIVPLVRNMPKLADVLEHWPEDAEVVYMGYWRRERWGLKQKVKTTLYLICHNLGLFGWNRFSRHWVYYLYARPYSPYFKKAGFHDGAHAYAVSLSGAQKLLNNQEPIVHSADHLISYTCLKDDNCKAYVTLPKFFDQGAHLDFEKLHSMRSDD